LGTEASSINAFSGLRRALSVAEQSPDLSDLPPNADIFELAPILIQKKRYLREDWLYKL